MSLIFMMLLFLSPRYDYQSNSCIPCSTIITNLNLKIIILIRRRLRQDFRLTHSRQVRTFYVPDLNLEAKILKPRGDYGHIYFKPSKVQGRYSEQIVSMLARVAEPLITIQTCL